MIRPEPHDNDINPWQDLDRWHDLLSSRYVCESCLTHYFMKYDKCKACGKIGSIQLLTAALFNLADSESELREMIAQGQRILFSDNPSPTPTTPIPSDNSTETSP